MQEPALACPSFLTWTTCSNDLLQENICPLMRNTTSFEARNSEQKVLSGRDLAGHDKIGPALAQIVAVSRFKKEVFVQQAAVRLV